jgi:hypothetical protein
VYSFVSVFVCWPRTYWLATAATGSQESKQSLKEGRKEGSFALLCFALLCLLACETVAFNWKISNSCGNSVWKRK